MITFLLQTPHALALKMETHLIPGISLDTGVLLLFSGIVGASWFNDG